MTGPTGIDPTPEKSRVAVLGTLAEFHREPIPFDLAALVRLVDELRELPVALIETRRGFGYIVPDDADTA